MPISFIVKIWLEESADDANSANRIAWRGHITHVPNGERRYVQDVDGIVDFIRPYLAELGIQEGKLQRIRRWLRQLKL